MRSPGSTGRTTSRWGSRMRCPGRRRAATTTSFSAIVNDWQVNGLLAAFSGTPFTVTASGTRLNTPSNTADGGPRRHVQRHRQDRRGGHVVRHDRVRAADWRSFRQHRPQPVPRSGGWNLDFSLFRSFPIGGYAAARVPAPGRQHLQPSGLRQPERRASRPATSDRSPASRISIRNGRSRWACGSRSDLDVALGSSGRARRQRRALFYCRGWST